MKISEKDLMYMYIRLHSMFLNFVSWVFSGKPDGKCKSALPTTVNTGNKPHLQISRIPSFEAQIFKKVFKKNKNVNQRIRSTKCELDFASIHWIIPYWKQKTTLLFAATFAQVNKLGNHANFLSTCYYSAWLLRLTKTATCLQTLFLGLLSFVFSVPSLLKASNVRQRYWALF